MRKQAIHIILFLVTFLFSACTEEIEIDLDSSYERIVIDGSISNEYKQHEVKIRKSADYFSNQPASPVENAEVSISNGEERFILEEAAPGIYKTDSLSGEIGKTYTLLIEIEGEEYTAQSKIHTIPPTDSIAFSINTWDTSYVDIKLYALEPATPDNHYLWMVYKNGQLATDTLDELSFSDDVLVNGNYIWGMEVQYIQAEVGDTITLETQSIPPGYYDYILNLLGETVWRGGPFDAPPANVPGNISNDALGYFRAYAVEQETRIITYLEKK